MYLISRSCHLLLNAAVVLILGSCGGNGDRLGDAQYASKPPGAPIAIFLTRQPDRPYDEIGIVRRPTSNDISEDIAWGQKQARRIGGDAIIVNQNAGQYVDNGPVRSLGGTYVSFVIIKWTDARKD